MSTSAENARPSLAAVLPLKVSGRHYGDNLARLDLLFSSLVHYAPTHLLDEIVVVVRDDEADLVVRHLEQWSDLPLRIAAEDEHFAAFRRYTRPWQVRPWQRQQIIKLNAPVLTGADFVLTLDPDVVAVKPLAREALLPGDRALLEPEARVVHRRWWLDSADLLDTLPRLERPGINVTPALLSRRLLRELHARLEAVNGRPWMDVLLTSYCDWTEYTLYLLAAEQSGLLDTYHVWAGGAEGHDHLHTDPALSIWDSAHASDTNLERLFDGEVPGLFAVVQSSTGLRARDVAAVASRHIKLRATTAAPAPAARGRSKLEERLNTAARLTAQRGYRLRRRTRRGSRPGSPEPEPAAGRH